MSIEINQDDDCFAFSTTGISIVDIALSRVGVAIPRKVAGLLCQCSYTTRISLLTPGPVNCRPFV